MDEKALQKRLLVIGVFMGALFLLLAGRLWQLQIVEGEAYAELAAGNRVRRIRVVAPRGRIFDRDMQAVATNRASFTVTVIPDDLPPGGEVLGRLAALLEMERGEIEAAIEEARRSTPRYEAVRIKRGVDAETVIKIEESRTDLPGVRIEEEPERVYPYGNLASHAVGNLRLISSAEFAKLEKFGYRASDLVGETGIEDLYERELRGTDGWKHVEVNALGRPIADLGKSDPIPGNDVVLTIDVDLQQVTEQALVDHMAEIRAGGEYSPTSGVAIVLDAKTGEVLAITSKPDFDPNSLVPGREERGSYYSKLLQSPDSPLLNRVTNGLYPPGSAFKPITAIAALEMNKTTRSEQFFADGYGPFAGMRDWTLRQGLPAHGWVNIVDAIAVSCNDFFWELGLRVTIDGIAEYAARFGFGQPTGFKLSPPETTGLLPTRDWKMRAFGEPWYPGDTASVAIGQGYLTTTPIRMAAFYLTLANKGKMLRPQLIKSVLSPAGEVLWKSEPEVTGYVTLQKSTWQTVYDGLQAVTTGKGTAAPYFKGFPVNVAGKSGSVQLGGGQDAHGWFAAFAPIEDPEIVVVVLAENAGGGSSGAAPVVRTIMDYYFGQN